MKQKALLILSFFLVLVLLVAGPVSAKEIKVVTQFPMSGTLGALPELGWGYIDAMKWFNEEQGGVDGKGMKITYFLEDMRYKPS
ncbi:MAG: hypothetical protein SV487_00590, partial [Thermodesulfobacteriota bacterium]|nr:hypothetical protein [Thermodesulfobacteriota bacterium]